MAVKTSATEFVSFQQATFNECAVLTRNSDHAKSSNFRNTSTSTPSPNFRNTSAVTVAGTYVYRCSTVTPALWFQFLCFILKLFEENISWAVLGNCKVVFVHCLQTNLLHVSPALLWSQVVQDLTHFIDRFLLPRKSLSASPTQFPVREEAKCIWEPYVLKPVQLLPCHRIFCHYYYYIVLIKLCIISIFWCRLKNCCPCDWVILSYCCGSNQQ